MTAEDVLVVAKQGLELAYELVDAGIPVVVCRPREGVLAGAGHDLVPRTRRWSRINAEDCRAGLARFRPGEDALAMVGGHGIDLVDVDTKADGTVEALPPFRYYGITETPSGGRHYVVASTGIGKIAGLTGEDGGFVGDYVGGTKDGGSRLLGYLPGSVRPKYPGAIYREAEEAPWDVGAVMAARPDPDLMMALLDAKGDVGLDSSEPRYVDDSPDRDPALGLHPYVRKSLDYEFSKLRRCAEEGWGTNWDNTTFSVACNLVEFANSNWSGYTLDAAYADLLAHAPTDDSFGRAEHEVKWESALKTIGDGGRPYPAGSAGSAADDFDAVPVDRIGEDEDAGEVDLYDENSLADNHIGERVGRYYFRNRFAAWGKNRWAGWDGRRWNLWTTETTVFDACRRALLHVVQVETTKADDLRGLRVLAADGDEDRIREAHKAHEIRMRAIRRLLSVGATTAVMRVARGVVERPLEEFDGPATYNHLNVGNGIVDLRTGELVDHDPSYGFTQVTPVRYRAGARHPDWTKALEALPDDVARWMQVRFGQAATGHATADDVVPFLKGSGENGKTTLVMGVKKALGEFCRPVPEKVLTAGPNDHPTELFSLKGVRLALLEELPGGDWLNVARLKRVSGTESGMSARPIGQDNVDWDPTHSLMVTTNHDVQINEVDHGTWRRLALVNFPFTFGGPDANRPKDDTLRDRLRDGEDGQWEAILAWVVEGAQTFYAEGLERDEHTPDSVKQDTLNWRFTTNQPAQFIEEFLEPTGEEQDAVLAREVYAAFCAWNESLGRRRLNDKTFWERARQHPLFNKPHVRKIRSKTRYKELQVVGLEPVQERERMVTGIRFTEPDSMLG